MPDVPDDDVQMRNHPVPVLQYRRVRRSYAHDLADKLALLGLILRDRLLILRRQLFELDGRKEQTGLKRAEFDIHPFLRDEFLVL